ncbi:MAG TPA: winged helix-turn-helix domain-containing protein, partial [Capillimicrobium sp.]
MGRLHERDPLDTSWAKAMSHPVRVRAMRILEEREASPSEIARELDLPIVNVSHHIKVLVKLGVIEQVAERYVRGAIEHRYRLVPRVTLSRADIELMPAEGVRRVITGAAGRIVGSLNDAIASERFYERTDNHVTWTPLELDEEGWANVYALLLDTLE